MYTGYTDVHPNENMNFATTYFSKIVVNLVRQERCGS